MKKAGEEEEWMVRVSSSEELDGEKETFHFKAGKDMLALYLENNPKSNSIGSKLWVNMFPYITFEINISIK